MKNIIKIVVTLISLASVLSACGAGNTNATFSGTALSSISVTPTNPSIAKGTTQQFTATGIYSDGTTKDITAYVSWSTSTTTVATINNASGNIGLASSLAPGSTAITASAEGVSGSTTLTVTPATLVSISITPANPSMTLGTSKQFTAVGTFSDSTTQDITASVTWNSSVTSVATISNAAGSHGLSASAAAGTTTIVAKDPTTNISGSTILTVTPAALASIAITPTNPIIGFGTSQQFTATGTFTDSTTQDLTTSVLWSSSTTSVATISNAAGSHGLSASVAAGTTIIVAKDPTTSISGSTTLTVNPAPLVSIAVTPTNPSIGFGTSQQFTATGTFADSTTQDLTTSVLWSSSTTSVANISNTEGSNGLATSVAVGTTTITATDSTTGISGSATFSITAGQMGGAIEGNPLTLSALVSTVAGLTGGLGSTDGTGTSALFNAPEGITTDGTNLYVADRVNCTIRKIVISSGLVSTFAGKAGSIGSLDGFGTAARFNDPYGITTDGTNLYVADTGNNTIRKIIISSGQVSTLAGTASIIGGSIDGSGPVARFNFPTGVTTDGTNLYVTDTWNNTIRKIVISTGLVSTLTGSVGVSGSADGTGTAALFNAPQGITTDGTNLYVADTWNNTIRKIVISSGSVSTLAGTAGVIGSTDGTGPAASFKQPRAITTDGSNLYVADTNNSTIRKIIISSGVVSTVAGTAGVIGSTDGTGAAASFGGIYGITGDGTNLYVTDGGQTIREIQ
jgi:sugar lactone lactonase YvrE